MRRTSVFVVAGVVLAAAVGLGLTWIVSSKSAASPKSAASALPPTSTGKGMVLQFSDKPLPLPALDLTDLEGHPLSPDRWHGKVLLVNFWATWCGPCREEIPTLVALQERYKDNLVILGLSIDTRPPAEVRDFVKQFSVNYPVAIASDALQQAFGGVDAVPSTFVVSPAGSIVQRHVGALSGAITEQEVRVLAGLSSDAAVQTVKDTGQVLLANAAYATEIPGVDLTALTPAQKELALKRMNTEHCTCGCGLTIAQCRINDSNCDVSLPLAKQIVKDVQQQE
jgi:thiol-disulfide isomerase/thioredoxin